MPARHDAAAAVVAAFLTTALFGLPSPATKQVLQLRQAVLSGDWAAATKHIGRLDLQDSPQALQVRLQLQQQAATGVTARKLPLP